MKLFLDVFVFQLQRKVNGKYEDDACNFSELHKMLVSRYPKKKLMAAFAQDLVKSFDKSFFCSEDNTKALSFCKSDSFTLSENENTISGHFVGGNTGQQYDVYNSDDATQITHVVQPTEVASLPFFFKLWFPKDFNSGVLVVQRYSTNTCLGLFKRRLVDYFRNMGYKFNAIKFVPEDKRNEFLENCTISQIGISWKKGLESTLKPQVRLLKNNSFSHKIKHISLSAQKILTDSAYRHEVFKEISTLYSQYDPSLHDLKFYYVDLKGQSASSTLEQLESLLPSVSLGITCVNPDNTPNWGAIEKVANSYIELTKFDLKYSAKTQS